MKWRREWKERGIKGKVWREGRGGIEVRGGDVRSVNM